MSRWSTVKRRWWRHTSWNDDRGRNVSTITTFTRSQCLAIGQTHGAATGLPSTCAATYRHGEFRNHRWQNHRGAFALRRSVARLVWARLGAGVYRLYSIPGTWNYPDTARVDGFSVVLFLPHGPHYRHPPQRGRRGGEAHERRFQRADHVSSDKRIPRITPLLRAGFEMAMVKCDEPSRRDGPGLETLPAEQSFWRLPAEVRSFFGSAGGCRPTIHQSCFGDHWA